MAIRSKRKKEIEEDNAQMSTLISHHRIKIPGVKTEGLKKTTEESIAHIINPQNKQDYKKHLLALKKRKSLEHFENSLGKDEMLIVATKKRFDHRMLAYCIYGNGETPEPLQGMNLHTPSSLKNIHIIVEKEPYFKKLSLRPLIAKRLLEYLKNADLKTDDCIQFMYHMSGITQLYAKKKDDWKGDSPDKIRQELLYREPQFSMEMLRSGDIVLLQRGDKFKHYAIYLDDGYFISKLGKDSLSISSLGQLKQTYRADEIQIIRRFYETDAYQQSEHTEQEGEVVAKLKKELEGL